MFIVFLHFISLSLTFVLELWFLSHTHRLFSSTRNGIAKFTNKMKPEKSVKREKEREDEEKKKTCAFLVIDLARS